MKCLVIPVVTGATGSVTKGLKTVWEFSIKTAVPGASHVARKVTQSENWSLSGGVNR